MILFTVVPASGRHTEGPFLFVSVCVCACRVWGCRGDAALRVPLVRPDQQAQPLRLAPEERSQDLLLGGLPLRVPQGGLRPVRRHHPGIARPHYEQHGRQRLL